MPIPDFISTPSIDGDENKSPWSTRVSEGTHQWLWDLQSEYGLNSKAETMRAVIFFAQEYLPKIAERLGEKFSERLAADAAAESAIREQRRRTAKHKKVLELLTMAAASESKPIKIRLEQAAKEMAKVWSIPYPPRGLPLITRDKDAAFVLRRVQQIMTEKSTSTIKLNELNPRVNKFNAGELREILDKLAKNDYLELRPEHTSGPETVWIVISAIGEEVFK